MEATSTHNDGTRAPQIVAGMSFDPDEDIAMQLLLSETGVQEYVADLDGNQITGALTLLSEPERKERLLERCREHPSYAQSPLANPESGEARIAAVSLLLQKQLDELLQ